MTPSDEILRTALDAIPQGILVCDANRRVLYANAAARAVLLGDSNQPLDEAVEKIRNKVWLADPRSEQLISPEKTPMARALRGETTEGEEYLLRHTGGVLPKWIECGARPLTDGAGAVIGAVLTVGDITGRKSKQLAMDAALQFSDFTYRESLAGIIRSTVDGRILDCNEAILRMLGYDSREEIFAIRMPQLFADAKDQELVLRMVDGERRVSEFEACLRRRDGTFSWALLKMRLLDPPVGQVGGSLITAAIDITERKQHEETIRQSEQRFAAFMRHLPGVAFIKDLSGRYVYYNEACWAQFHIRPEEIIGKTDEDIWPADHASRYRDNDATVVDTKRPIEFVEPVSHPDGAHSWLLYKFPIIEAGEVAFVGGIGIDITERRILEEQLTQARKMEALGRLAGGVAHDFNNLLTVISGYGQLALEGAGNTSQEKMISWLQEVINSSRRAAALTSQLLAFSRRQAVEPSVVELADLLRSMERLLQRVIGEHVELTVRCGPGPCRIRADTHQMEQVIMNLAVNARDAMPLGGTLELHCCRLSSAMERAHGEPEGEPLTVLLEVRDNGIGMNDSIRARIFDPFFTSKEPGKGTGLGLSMVYGVVSQARGRIDVESTEGAGTAFRIYFPAEENAAVGPVPGRISSTPKGEETVLLVEDEKSVRTLAETILARLGYKVLAADSGEMALGIWESRNGRIDVLVTDVIMPQMSGGDLAHKLREINPRLKVLFMSGYTDDMIASHGVLAGETQLIQKPFTAEALGRKLRDVLDA